MSKFRPLGLKMKYRRNADEEAEEARAAAERELTRLSSILKAQTEELEANYSQVRQTYLFDSFKRTS